MIQIVPATPAHVGMIANRMRDIDCLECEMFGRSPKQALRMALTASAVAWTAKVDGRPEAMFGASSLSAIEGIGVPWMLMTDEAVRHGRALLVLGRRYSDELQRRFPTLENAVHADNAVAIRWLERLGYTVGPIVAMNGQPMRGFVRKG